MFLFFTLNIGLKQRKKRRKNKENNEFEGGIIPFLVVTHYKQATPEPNLKHDIMFSNLFKRSPKANTWKNIWRRGTFD